MGYSLKAEPIIAEILPGTLVLGLLLFDKQGLNWLSKDIPNTKILAFFIGAWVIGNIIDAIRNSVVEENLDKRKEHEIKWEHLLKEESQRFAQHYFSYYKLDVNFVIGIFLLTILHFFVPSTWFGGGSYLSCCEFVFLLFLTFVFFWDARSLRKEMVKITNRDKEGATDAEK